MSEALRACPMCGGADMAIETFFTSTDTLDRVKCRACETTGPYGGTKEIAVRHWNRRAPVALPSREEVAALIRDGRAHEATSDQIADAILALMKGEG